MRIAHSGLTVICLLLSISCDRSRPASPEARQRFESVIPKPVSAQLQGSSFMFTHDTRVVVNGGAAGLEETAQLLADELQQATGFDVAVSPSGEQVDATVSLRIVSDEELGSEGYQLSVSEEGVEITANAAPGIYRGLQTLKQLLPPSAQKAPEQDGVWEIATGTIRDYPQYAWRGSMLDVARHFFTVEDVKRYIDLISLYKMNVLHLHLSDDQGWRIEIKSWPDLTRIGGRTEVGGGEGGFYTQEEYADIVRYASSRFITIVPEIDMPGHINAALVSYQELNPGTPIRTEPGRPRPKAGVEYTGIEVGFSTLDIKKEITFRFVNDVLRELAEMTPGPYLHIGGDEAAVTKKADYIQFINRFKEIVDSNEKKMIGWEEIAQANVDSTVTVQHWHSQEYAKMAAEKGAKLILSPSRKVYLDMQYDSTSRLGLHWAAYIEVDSSYLWDPATHVDGIDQQQILGVEAPLWSETLETMDDIEYLLFPRLPGVAEVGWTKADERNWDEYKVRLARHADRWNAMGIDFYRSPKVPWDDADESVALDDE